VRTALGEMGITVLGGAITSLGASGMLFGCWLAFFQKFGGFMFGTILFSILWSLGFFMACMASFGPEKNFGSVICLRRMLGHKVTLGDPAVNDSVDTSAGHEMTQTHQSEPKPQPI